MSRLHDTVLAGAHGLRLGGWGGITTSGDAAAGDVRKQRVRKSQSHGSFLNPLLRLTRDPKGVISDILGDWQGAGGAEKLGQHEESKRQVLYLRMNNAKSYDEWCSAAGELDKLEGNDAWKLEDESAEYDYQLVEARLRQLDDARISCKTSRMLFLLRTSLTRGLGGMGDLRLYKHSHIGTKALIERYIDSAEKTIAALLKVSAKHADGEPDGRVLLEQMLQTRQSFGRSALLLSGGGTFGMNHIGVVKCLWEVGLLPRIVSGASAGSIVAAVLGAKTDAEIPAVLEGFCYGDLGVFEKTGEEEGVLKKAARFLKFGAIFDIRHLVRVMRNILGDLTFQEAYNRTRRILNITVSSESLYELPRLLNYVTAPNVIIWSAVAASCSVPLIFPATPLLAKDPKTGKEVPWNPSPQRWIDGSVDNDLPMTRLAEMFNVNHFIVSQVNPHVVPFLKSEEENIAAQAQGSTATISAGPSWFNSMASLAKGEALHRLHVLAELGIFPNYCTKVRSVLSQRYSGDITIFPEIPYSAFPKVLSNPTVEFMVQASLSGEKATWPKLSRIKNHCAIELALDEAIRQLRARVAFSPSQVDLRQSLQGYTHPSTSSSDRGRKLRQTRSSHRVPRMIHKEHTALAAPEADRWSLDMSKACIISIPAPSTHPRKSTQAHNVTRPLNPLSPSAFKISSSEALSSEPDDNNSTDADDDIASLSSSDSPQTPHPELWPTTRQLFPSASQPTTPSIASSFGALSMTASSSRYPPAPNPNLVSNPTHASTAPSANPGPPSSPEHKYKRLFHRRRGSGSAAAAAAQTAADPARPPSGRRGSAATLHLDISGTRGMFLRRKKSALFKAGPDAAGGGRGD